MTLGLRLPDGCRPRFWRPIAYAGSAVVGLALVYQPVSGLMVWPFLSDSTAYWDAAGRMLANEPLYQPGATPFLYAPWFAWLWIPMRALPFAFAMVAWLTMLIAAWLWLCWRARHSPLMPMCAGALLAAAWVGNVHPLIVFVLAASARAPWAVAVTASLKGGPILFLAGERSWRRVALAVALLALLLAPILLYNFTHYPFGEARATPIRFWPFVAAFAVALAIVGARTRYREWALAVAVILVQPRPILYDLGFLLIPMILTSTVATDISANFGDKGDG